MTSAHTFNFLTNLNLL